MNLLVKLSKPVSTSTVSMMFYGFTPYHSLTALCLQCVTSSTFFILPRNSLRSWVLRLCSTRTQNHALSAWVRAAAFLSFLWHFTVLIESKQTNKRRNQKTLKKSRKKKHRPHVCDALVENGFQCLSKKRKNPGFASNLCGCLGLSNHTESLFLFFRGNLSVDCGKGITSYVIAYPGFSQSVFHFKVGVSARA